MRLLPTSLPGCTLVGLDPSADERGSFTRLWSAPELGSVGIDPRVAQASISHNSSAGTLRGLHYQVDPHAETKFVYCVRGRLFDVAVDVRRGSDTFGNWFGIELAPELERGLVLGPGLAHGFLTLEDRTEILYLISKPYEPTGARGVRWDDPTIDVKWPAPGVLVISDRDRSLPLLRDAVDLG